MAKAKMDYAEAVALIGEASFKKFASLPAEQHRAYAIIGSRLVKLGRVKTKADKAQAKADELKSQYEQSLMAAPAAKKTAKKAKKTAEAEPEAPKAKGGKKTSGGRTSGSLAE